METIEFMLAALGVRTALSLAWAAVPEVADAPPPAAGVAATVLQMNSARH